HLTAAAVAPAILLVVVLIDRRAIGWRNGGIAALIVVAGLAQYAFILLRTAQHAPYLEARASNLRELFAVMRASRFSDQIFAFSLRQLMVERVPELWHLSVIEFTPVGILLGLAGLAAVIVNRITAGTFLIVGA